MPKNNNKLTKNKETVDTILAPTLKRVFAFIIDVLFAVFPFILVFILWFFYQLLQTFFGFSGSGLLNGLLVIAGIGAFGWMIYSYVIQYKTLGKFYQTVGMKKVGIELVSTVWPRSTPLGMFIYLIGTQFVFSLFRSPTIYFWIALLNFAWIFLNKDKQTLIGLILKIRVVKKKESNQQK